MSKTTANPEFNVLTGPWLEVMDLHARLQRVSVVDALRHAAELGQIVSPNPLDVFAAYRFLLTLLYWKSPDCGGVQKLRDALLEERIPRPLIPALKKEEGSFNPAFRTSPRTFL